MKQVFSSPNNAEVSLMRSVLESAEIPCEVRNEAVSQIMVGLPFAAELWILRDEDLEAAAQMISDFKSKS